MNKEQTLNLIKTAKTKNKKLDNCVYDLSTFRGRTVLDEFETYEEITVNEKCEIKITKKTRTKSQTGIGRITISRLNYQGSQN